VRLPIGCSRDQNIYGQYFQLYFQRLMLLLPRLKEACAAHLPGVAVTKAEPLYRQHFPHLNSSITAEAFSSEPYYSRTFPSLTARWLSWQKDTGCAGWRGGSSTASILEALQSVYETVRLSWRDQWVVAALAGGAGPEGGHGLRGARHAVQGKEMKLKPIILDEYNKQARLGSEVGANTFVADDDFIVLEDEGARVKLVGASIDIKHLVTGGACQMLPTTS